MNLNEDILQPGQAGLTQEELALAATLLSQKKPSAPERSRLVVVETVYCQPPDTPGVANETRYSKFLETDEQIYGPRRMISGEEWKPLDCGWINEASMLTITNEEGKHLQKNPTQEEQAVINARIIELGVITGVETVPFAKIPPRESLRLTPTNLSRWVIRCCKGKAKALITLFPV